MRIVVVGGAGTIGKAVVAALGDRHEIVVAGRRSGAVHVDIRLPDSVRAMYQQVGQFDALVCAAGEAFFGPFDTMSEADLALGIESKLLGQIRLVLQGRSLISDAGSFTLISGYILDDPIPPAASFAVANGGVEGFVRAAALNLDRGIRINAVSPGLAEDSGEQFARFNPGRIPVPMRRIGAAFMRSVEGWRTGESLVRAGRSLRWATRAAGKARPAALARHVESLAAQQPRLVVTKGDVLDQGSLRPALDNIDAVICTVGIGTSRKPTRGVLRRHPQHP